MLEKDAALEDNVRKCPREKLKGAEPDVLSEEDLEAIRDLNRSETRSERRKGVVYMGKMGSILSFSPCFAW